MSAAHSHIYQELGVKPVINAVGNMTLLGGSRLSPAVLETMVEANRHFVDMNELLDHAGQRIADLIGAEAAYVTPGCGAALTLGTAACITGDDPEKMERIPDTTGMRHEILIQRQQRYKYDRCVTVPGGVLVEMDGAEGLEAAIGPKTAAILYLAPGRGEGIIPLHEVIRVGKRHGIPVIVDAASQVYPVEYMRSYPATGADLVCYGAKYFGAPNSTGVLCGRRDLVRAASQQGFIGFEAGAYRTFGRPFKLDRQEIVAVVVALREWVSMDHETRLAGSARRVRSLQQRLGGLPHVTVQPLPEGMEPATGLSLTLDEQALGKTAAEVVQTLREGNPSIWVDIYENALLLWMGTVYDGEEEIIATRLKELL
ncbi:MAG: aminotransferase class V-fold PLP-dependent enzyme [Candidatus Latescibacteria bacterium]|nr:aminotransferase class V-fold PLP-dependent enzyme [Candidatus Latescibacterota bacterium]